MKRIKQVTAILIFIMIGLITGVNNFSEVLNDYTVQTITINNSTMNLAEYKETLTESLGADAILLSVHAENGIPNWYCLGSLCNLDKTEYYSLTNDQVAKAIIPLKLAENYKIYSFESLNNIYTGHNSYTLVSRTNNIDHIIKRIADNGLVVDSSATKMQTIGNSKMLICIVSMLCLYLIAIVTEFKRYVINKFNGKLVSEEFKMIILQTTTLLFISLVIEIPLMYVLVYNTPLLINLIPKVFLGMIIVAILFIILNFFACLYVNKHISYKKVTNTVSKYINIAAYTSLIVILLLSATNFWKINQSLNYIMEKKDQLPPSELNDYYTYSLRMYGAVDLNYMDEVVDPLHAKFYRMTEDKYNGIVMDFDNYSADYPIVNSNYLDYIDYHPKLNSSKINLLIPPTSNQVENNNQYNEVLINDEKFPYINWETGLIEYYSGPLIVVNKNVTTNVKDQDISVNIQSNNYFLQVDNKTQLMQLRALINNLNLDQNMSDLYPVTAISSDYKLFCKQQLKLYMLYQGVQTILIGISLIMYLTYRFKLNETRFIIKYCFGKQSYSIVMREQLLITIAFLPLLVISPTKYTIMYFLTFQILSLLIIAVNWKRIKTKISSVLKQM